MRCPFCRYEESRVVDSRAAEEGSSIRRRRECLRCVKRFTTYEMVETIPLIIVKKDGRRVKFDGVKILSGLLKACEKRPVALDALENLVANIEKELRNSMDKEVRSRQIGEMVMRRLKELDQVAYVRFASVYREFADIDNFIEELKQLKKGKPGKADLGKR